MSEYKEKKKENKPHTANYIVSSFLLSNRSLKKIYDLSLSSIAVLRYICDSIDSHYTKHKKFHTRLFQSQIAKHCWSSIKTVWRIIQHLIKKRFIKYDPKKNIFTLGKVLLTYVKMTYPIEVRQNDVGHRSTSNLRTSKSSKLTKSESIHKRTKNNWKGMAPTARKASDILENFMKEEENKCSH